MKHPLQAENHPKAIKAKSLVNDNIFCGGVNLGPLEYEELAAAYNQLATAYNQLSCLAEENEKLKHEINNLDNIRLERDELKERLQRGIRVSCEKRLHGWAAWGSMDANATLIFD